MGDCQAMAPPAPLADPGPELSSMASALDALADRLAAMIDRAAGADWLTNDLYALERSLGEARRRMSRLTRTADARSRLSDPRRD